MMSTPDAAAKLTSPRSARLSADDWAQAALELIAKEGVSAVAVEPLARQLGVTKGSFYWHFPSRDALLRAALERWEKFEQEIAFIPLREHVPDPRKRLCQLIGMITDERTYTTHIVYAALMKASDHPCVRPVLERIAQQRIDYLVATFRQMGLPEDTAMYRSWLVYTAYIGFLQWNLQLGQAKITREQFSAYIEHMVQTLIPAE